MYDIEPLAVRPFPREAPSKLVEARMALVDPVERYGTRSLDCHIKQGLMHNMRYACTVAFHLMKQPVWLGIVSAAIGLAKRLLDGNGLAKTD